MRGSSSSILSSIASDFCGEDMQAGWELLLLGTKKTGNYQTSSLLSTSRDIVSPS
jgi:hypothetical protein